MQASVVTWKTASDNRINLTPQQTETLEQHNVWPKNDRGEEFCQVYHGLHYGPVSLSDDDIQYIIENNGSLPEKDNGY